VTHTCTTNSEWYNAGMVTIPLLSLLETTRWAESFMSMLKALPHPHGATTITLSGELGAGKTTFTQALAQALSMTEVPTSPTFVVMKQYPLRETWPWRQLVHIDLYRMEDISELEPLRFTEILCDPENLVVIEWPERARALMPDDAHRITLTVEKDGTRTLSYEPQP
jgi:tRNA threonylcarbamoyladenosine biosynthesis protein TsaE